MEKVMFLLLVAVAVPVLGWGQTVDGINLGETKHIKYIEIVGMQKLLSMKITIRVDYGQAFDWGKDSKVEKDGKNIVFNTMMDAVNRFNYWGWDLMFAYPVSEGNAGSVYHYVMRRRPEPEAKD